MPVKPGSESGLSLIELMVAMLLLAVALLGLAAAFAPSRIAIEEGNQITTGVGLARQTLENMRNRVYDSTTDELTSANYPAEAYGSIPNFPGYRRSVLIEDGVPQTNTKRVTVTVNYRDNKGVEQAVRLVTIFVRST